MSEWQICESCQEKFKMGFFWAIAEYCPDCWDSVGRKRSQEVVREIHEEGTCGDAVRDAHRQLQLMEEARIQAGFNKTIPPKDHPQITYGEIRSRIFLGVFAAMGILCGIAVLFMVITGISESTNQIIAVILGMILFPVAIFVGFRMMAAIVTGRINPVFRRDLFRSIPSVSFGTISRQKENRFYNGLATEQIALYQEYFEAMIAETDIENLTLFSLKRKYDENKRKSDFGILIRICDQASKEKLNPEYLRVMFFQFVFADYHERTKYLSSWVERVLQRKDIDFFPDPNAIASDRLSAPEPLGRLY